MAKLCDVRGCGLVGSSYTIALNRHDTHLEYGKEGVGKPAYKRDVPNSMTYLFDLCYKHYSEVDAVIDNLRNGVPQIATLNNPVSGVDHYAKEVDGGDDAV